MANDVVGLLTCNNCGNLIIHCHHDQSKGKNNVRKTKTEKEKDNAARMPGTTLRKTMLHESTQDIYKRIAQEF